MIVQITRYIEILKTQQANVLNLLQLGKEKNEIKEKLSETGVRALEEIVDLYEWKNGINDSITSIPESELFPEGIMLSLEAAIENYQIYNQRKIWKSHFFPLFTNGAGEFILIDTVSVGHPLFLYAPSLLLSDEPVAIYESLKTMFITLIECFEKGAYYITADRLMELDFDLKYEISEKNNPSSDFWKL